MEPHPNPPFQNHIGAMAYICELRTGQTISLDNPASQTQVVVSLCSPGQQQQSSSCFQTGTWLSPPVAFLRDQGLLIKIIAAQGESYIQIQGNSMGLMAGVPDTSGLTPVGMREGIAPQANPASGMEAMPAMKPMQPMQPMDEGLKLDNMQMNLSAMQMQMGNMHMSMGSPSAAEPQRKFCTQCGGSVAVSDRFCGSCGQSLQ